MSSRRVLLLEPDLPMQRLMKVILTGSGYEVICVRDGREAVRAISTRDFAGFVVDLSPPPGSLQPALHLGAGFLHYLQREHVASLRRVIVLSALPDRDIASEVPPVCKVLRKPFDLQELRETVSNCWS